MAVTVEAKLSLEDFAKEVAAIGLPFGAAPKALPKLEEERWALLAPYVGKPLSAIPTDLVFLFLLTHQNEVNPPQWADQIRQLPIAERMVSSATAEDDFI